eukprot:1474896-Pyramimonas_sp.AAC.1
MCDNPKYGSIGALARDLEEIYGAIKGVHADRHGPVVEEATMKRCRNAVDFGVETVGFTFALFCIVRTWPAEVVNVAQARVA